MGLSWLVLLFSLLPNKLQSQSSDTTIFNFSSFVGHEADLIYQGDAYIPTDRTPSFPLRRYVRLTSADPPNSTHRRATPLPNSVGRILYSRPIRLWDAAERRQANFQTQIRGHIGSPLGGRIGDGISVFMAPVNSSIPGGSTGGHMGLYGTSGTSPTPVFAVELDVCVNTWDPSFRHVGINANSRTSLSVASWDAGGFERTVEARITYDARQRLISVLANASYSSSWSVPLISTVEHTLDLKTILPEWVQIGISASTSQQDLALHEIFDWTFISFMESDDHLIA